MLQSPAKRRKTSETTSVPATNHNTNAPNRSTPTTPTRASYLSPTKASLARSHPHLVSHNNARSLTEPRGRLLRNELLTARNTNTSQSEKPQSSSIAELTNNQLNQEETIPPAAILGTSAQTAVPHHRAPLQQRQPSTHNRVRGRSPSVDAIPQPILPKLVKRTEGPRRAVSRPRSNEPELPPTPVQLGLDAPPQPPRGLSSSSPRGSKSGSGRRRTRVLDGQSVTSSPLKPKTGRTTMQGLESQIEVGHEAPESQAPMPDEDDEDLPEELREKSTTLRNLKDELRKLKEQTSKVEEAMNSNDLPEDIGKDTSFANLLKSGHRPALPLNTSFEQETATKDSETPYRDLFAPGNLQLKTKTATRMVKGLAKVIHHVSITAPSPWPSEFFCANFEVITDAEEVRVERVIWTDTKGRTQAPGIQNELHGWIQDRLKSDLHCLDIGGLIWGVGMYFNASVERAKTFKTLARRYEGTLDGDDSEEDGEGADNDAKEEKMTEDEALALMRYLTKSQLEFEIKSEEESSRPTRRSKKAAPKIMAIWKLEPTWHGEVRSICEVASSGIPDSAQEAVVELFERVKEVGGFEKAFGAVWDMVSHVVGKAGDGQGDGVENEKGKGKKRKRFA